MVNGTYLVIDEKSELKLSVVIKQAAVGAHCGDDDHALLFALERLHGAHLDLARPEVLSFQPFLDFVHLYKMESIRLPSIVPYLADCVAFLLFAYLTRLLLNDVSNLVAAFVY